MPCTACTKNYGLFLRETGCGICGFSFCTKCVKYSVKSVTNKKVCLTCFNKSNIKSVDNGASKTIQEKESNPSNTTADSVQSATPVANTIPESDLPKGFAVLQNKNKDRELQNRLQGLKQREQEGKVLTTDDSIRARLAALRGEQYTGESAPNRDIYKVDSRSDQEKINDLFKQYTEEAEIKNSHDPAKDIESRLQTLKQDMPGSSTNPATSAKTAVDDTPDDDKKFIQKVLEEAFLDARLNLNDDERELIEGIPQAPNKADVEELPWCTICNEDAKIRCEDCDDELYCRPCFKEIHQDDEEYREHRTKAYQK